MQLTQSQILQRPRPALFSVANVPAPGFWASSPQSDSPPDLGGAAARERVQRLAYGFGFGAFLVGMAAGITSFLPLLLLAGAYLTGISAAILSARECRRIVRIGPIFDELRVTPFGPELLRDQLVERCIPIIVAGWIGYSAACAVLVFASRGLGAAFTYSLATPFFGAAIWTIGMLGAHWILRPLDHGSFRARVAAAAFTSMLGFLLLAIPVVFVVFAR